MKNKKKIVGFDSISIDVQKCIGIIGLTWLTRLFNKILYSQKMPNVQRKNIIVSIIRTKVTSKTVRIIGHQADESHHEIVGRDSYKRITQSFIYQCQFGSLPERLTTKIIFLLRQVMEQFRANKKNLYMVFIDLEKTYDRVLRNIIWRTLKVKRFQTYRSTSLKICTQELILVSRC